MSVESFTNVACRNSAPYDIGKSWRHVIERLNAYARLVRRGQHRKARPQARAEDADALESLLSEPRDCAPRVEHCLSAHLDGSRDIRAHDVVGARQLRRHADVVIRQAHAKRRHAETRQRSRQPHVPFRVGIPLRQDQHRAPSGAAEEPGGGSPAAGNQRACTVLFSACGVASALGNRNVPASPRARWSGVACAKRYSCVGRASKNRGVSRITSSTQWRSRSAGRLGPVRRNPVEAPFEWSNDAICRQRDETAFPRVKKRSRSRPQQYFGPRVAG